MQVRFLAVPETEGLDGWLVSCRVGCGILAVLGGLRDELKEVS